MTKAKSQKSGAQTTKIEQPMQIRFFIACPQSGSTPLEKTLANPPVFAAIGRFWSDIPGLQAFPDCVHPPQLQTREISDIYSASAHTRIQSIILIHDPVRVFDNWMYMGRKGLDAQNLINWYSNMFQRLDQAPPNTTTFLLFEKFIRNPRQEIERICRWWGVSFSDTLLKQPLQSPFFNSPTFRKTTGHGELPLGRFTTREARVYAEMDVPYHDFLSNAQKDNIEIHLGRQYLKCWEADVYRLREIIAGKSWVAFHLDDTLHEFRRSSEMATRKVLVELSERFGFPMCKLRDTYSKQFEIRVSSPCFERQTSFDCRRDIIRSVIKHFVGLPQDEQLISVQLIDDQLINEQLVDDLLKMYETTFMTSLELKCGALGLLSTIKELGKRVVVITEGERDENIEIIRGLGIDCYIDVIYHINAPQTSSDWLEIPHDMMYVGHSPRNMEHAMAGDNNVFSFDIAEDEHVCLTSLPPKVNTLRKLQYIISE